jgi:hypothetical protein
MRQSFNLEVKTKCRKNGLEKEWKKEREKEKKKGEINNLETELLWLKDK